MRQGKVGEAGGHFMTFDENRSRRRVILTKNLKVVVNQLGMLASV